MHRTSKMPFLYFAYGSNLLRERLRLQNPSAEFVSIGKLEGYSLGFSNLHIKPDTLRWRGAAATILDQPGETVWGCIWRLDEKHKATLDKQEGVYTAIDVEVTQMGGQNPGTVCGCRTYQLTGDYLRPSSYDSRPSPMYMDVIIRGAVQNCLPDDYIAQLRAIETNGWHEDIELYRNILKLLGE